MNEDLKKLIEKAAVTLKAAGAREVYVFGSAASGTMREDSDVDLAVSGLPVDQFVYIGYLPRKSGQRAAALEGLKDEPRTIVAFEAPHRLREALEDIRTVLGERPLAVCRELTKLHEEIFRGAPSEALAHFQDPRGEITLVISGAPASLLTDDDIRAELARLRQQGLSASAAARQAAQTLGLPRSRVYPLAVERQT